MTFTELELAYLASQRLGRLATVDTAGRPQNNPVGFAYNPGTGTVDIGGHRLAGTRKFRNVAATGVAAFVVDDLVSVSPWRVRGVEVRGRAEALAEGRELIRIHPRQVFSWGLDPENPGMQRRTVG